MTSEPNPTQPTGDSSSAQGASVERVTNGRSCCGVAEDEPCEGWHRTLVGWVPEWTIGHDCDCDPRACTHKPCPHGPGLD